MKLNHPIDTIFILQIHREVDLSSSYLMIWNKTIHYRLIRVISGKSSNYKSTDFYKLYDEIGGRLGP